MSERRPSEIWRSTNKLNENAPENRRKSLQLYPPGEVISFTIQHIEVHGIPAPRVFVMVLGEDGQRYVAPMTGFASTKDIGDLVGKRVRCTTRVISENKTGVVVYGQMYEEYDMVEKI